ncbi:MAG: DUF2330 domain-containing protein [Myxococcota bacterium]
MIAAWLANSVAQACGGFFCDNLQPVDQSGEDIVFAVKDGIVTTHVQIAYEGAADGFAWILPVPGIPDVGLSSDSLFAALDRETRQDLRLAWVYEQSCNDADADTDSDADSDADADITTYGTGLGVTVVSEAAVGPYESVVIQATDGAALVDWLQANGYGVPDALGDKMGPYLAPGMSFVALKLLKDADVVAGTLAPLRVSWPGDRPSIPLTLTSVAAAEDMPVTVYVLGQARAVPTNYLHVQLNPLGHDWFRDGTAPPAGELLRRATDEAGGRAFTTIYAQPLPDHFWWADSFVLDGLAELTDPLAWLLALPAHGFSGTSDVLGVLRIHLPAPEGVDEDDLYNLPNEYPDVWAALAPTFDAVAATADLEARVVIPRQDIWAMFDANPYATRLETAISPDEMSVDPQFAFNPDLPNVAPKLQADFHLDCGAEVTVEDGERWFVLPGGYTVPAPTIRELGDQGLGSWAWSQMGHAALVVEQLSDSGPGTLVADHTAELVPPTPLGEGGDAAGGGGCGCAGPDAPDGAGVALIGALALAVRRRRRG